MAITTFDLLFRDYATDGEPLSGAHNPVKVDIRDTLNYKVPTATGGFYSNHNSLDAGREDATIARTGDRFIMGDDDDFLPGRTYNTVSSITRSGTTATVTTGSAHGYTTGNSVQITGADQTEYCGIKTITVTGASTFTYTVSGTPTTPATGTLRHSIISGTNSWLEILRANTVKNAQMTVLSADGFIGGIFGSRNSDNAIAGEDAIALSAWVLNDGTDVTDRGFAAYLEAVTTGVGGAIGQEIDIVCGHSSETNISAASPYVDGSTIGLWIASGGDKKTKPFAINAASAAIGIVNNGETFLKGIVFGYNALDGCDGTTGSAVAIQMIKGHQLQWLIADGNIGTNIMSDVSDRTYATQITFSNDGFLIQPIEDTDYLFLVSGGSTAVNGVRVTPGATGIGSTISAIGETDVDLILAAKGTGVVKLSNSLTLPATSTITASTALTLATPSATLTAAAETLFDIYRSGNGANANYVGDIRFRANNTSGASTTNYTKIYVQQANATSHHAKFFIGVAESGSLQTILEHDGSVGLTSLGKANKVQVNATGTGLNGVTPVAKASAITAPTGGATVDTEARAAVALVITAIKNIGITA